MFRGNNQNFDNRKFRSYFAQCETTLVFLKDETKNPIKVPFSMKYRPNVRLMFIFYTDNSKIGQLFIGKMRTIVDKTVYYLRAKIVPGRFILPLILPQTNVFFET